MAGEVSFWEEYFAGIYRNYNCQLIVVDWQKFVVLAEYI